MFFGNLNFPWSGADALVVNPGVKWESVYQSQITFFGDDDNDSVNNNHSGHHNNNSQYDGDVSSEITDDFISTISADTNAERETLFGSDGTLDNVASLVSDHASSLDTGVALHRGNVDGLGDQWPFRVSKFCSVSLLTFPSYSFSDGNRFAWRLAPSSPILRVTTG